jgi:hypothetical protein
MFAVIRRNPELKKYISNIRKVRRQESHLAGELSWMVREVEDRAP